MEPEPFIYRVTDGWLRDLASAPTPQDRWPCIRWDDDLLRDQFRFLDIQAEVGVNHNVAWGLFIDRAWPVPLENVIDAERERRLKRFVDAAHGRGIKVLSGVGIYSWGFDEIIRQAPGVAAGHAHAMCAHRDEAWEWQRRVLDFLMDPRWNLDGLSMQSADQGRCDCSRCIKLSPAEHHALVLVRAAEYVRSQRPDWVIGQASWGLRLDEESELAHLQHIAAAVDYMVEVRERSAQEGRRAQLAGQLRCTFGSVGGVFVEPPQHWDRRRWFVPCGLGSARALRALWADGGRACEYFYRPFANPVEEVSWRVGARILRRPQIKPEVALADSLEAVYGVTGPTRRNLAEWFARGEQAYFGRSTFVLGEGPLSLEPLVWAENPATPGPAVYLRDRMAPEAMLDYARDLSALRGELEIMSIPNGRAKAATLACIEGTLRDVQTLTTA